MSTWWCRRARWTRLWSRPSTRTTTRRWRWWRSNPGPICDRAWSLRPPVNKYWTLVIVCLVFMQSSGKIGYKRSLLLGDISSRDLTIRFGYIRKVSVLELQLFWTSSLRQQFKSFTQCLTKPAGLVFCMKLWALSWAARANADKSQEFLHI